MTYSNKNILIIAFYIRNMLFFKKCFMDIIMGTIVEIIKYNEFINNIVNDIFIKAKTLGTLRKELLYFITIFDPDPEFEELPENLNELDWKKRLKYYNKKIKELLDLKNDDNVGFILNISLYVIFDLFYKLLNELNKKRFKSFLVNFFWQQIITPIILINEDINEDITLNNYIAFYFFNHNSIIFPNFSVLNDDILTRRELDRDRFNENFKNYLKENITNINNYSNYMISIFFGPILIGFNEKLENIIYGFNIKNKAKANLPYADVQIIRAFLYIFLVRTINDYIIYIKEDYIDEWENLVVQRGHLNFNQQTINDLKKNLGGMFNIIFTAVLRELFIEYYLFNYKDTKNNNAIEFFNEENNNRFLRKIKNQIREEDFYKKNSEDITRLLKIINEIGGLNFMQFSSFDVIEKNDIQYPLGYVTGEI